jgi:hypothetical protein
MIAAALPLAGAGLSVMATAIQSLYGMAVGINDYLDKHIEDMKCSDNPTISRTGNVLGMAKLGFGIGYITPVVIISAGQLLLGNTLAAVTTVATAATLTNPIAMTCAAFGAIYYGWSALSDVERNEILEKLSNGLEVGLELISAMIRFVVEKTKEFFDSKNFTEMKNYISEKAAVFGKSLGDVTHNLKDRASDAFDIFKTKSAEVAAKTGDLASDAMAKAGEAMDKTSVVAGVAFDTVKEASVKAADGARERLENLKLRDVSRNSSESVKSISPPAQSTASSDKNAGRAT